MAKTEVKKMLKAFNTAYYGPSWHGDHMKRVLDNLTEKDMMKRMGGSNSILDLVLHIINWRHYVMNCIRHQSAWQQSQTENFTAGMNYPTLKEATNEIDNTQNLLNQMLNTIPDIMLDDLVDTHCFTYREIVYGLINHDLYHLGQINIIKKYCT